MAGIGVNRDFKPFGDWVLVEPIEPGVTAGGVALPEGVTDNQPMGVVRRVGPGAVTDSGARAPLDAAEDDVVFLCFNDYNRPAVLQIDGERYIVCRSRDLLGSVTKKAA